MVLVLVSALASFHSLWGDALGMLFSTSFGGVAKGDTAEIHVFGELASAQEDLRRVKPTEWFSQNRAERIGRIYHISTSRVVIPETAYHNVVPRRYATFTSREADLHRR